MPVAETDAFTNLMLVLVGTLVLGIAATVIFRKMVPGMVLRLLRTEEAEHQYLELLREGYVIRDRLRGLQEEQARFELERGRLATALRRLETALAEPPVRVPHLIHEISEPRSDQTRHVARVSVESTSPLLRTTSDRYNPLWLHMNLAEIWAFSREEARQMLELAYPGKLGYQKAFIDDVVTMSSVAGEASP